MTTPTHPTDAPTPERPADPTPEAFDFAMREYGATDREDLFDHEIERINKRALQYDAFAKILIERERVRCVKIANNNAFLAAQAEPQSTAANWCARVTAAIVSGETP